MGQYSTGPFQAAAHKKPLSTITTANIRPLSREPASPAHRARLVRLVSGVSTLSSVSNTEAPLSITAGLPVQGWSLTFLQSMATAAPSRPLNMLESVGLHHALFREQGPISAECFDEWKPALFLTEGAPRARIEVYPADQELSETSSLEGDPALCGHPSSGFPLGFRQTAHDEELPGRKRVDSHASELVSIGEVERLKQYVGRKRGVQVFFIRQRNSYSPLSITLAQFETLLSLKRVSPQFKDYVTYMGERRREVEIAPPKLRWRRPLPYNTSQSPNAMECMYGLRYVELNGRESVNQPTSRWSLRQSVVHHSHCQSHLPSSWIFITLPRLAETRVNEHLPHCPTRSACSQFGIHLLIHDTANANWRPYLIDMAAEIDHHAARLLGASPDDQGPIGMEDCGERQALLVLDRALINASVVVRSTTDNVRALGDFHQYARKQEGIDDGADDICSFAIQEQLRELDQISGRIDALRAELQGITNMVASFLDLDSGLVLQKLAKESSKENEYMRKLTQKSAQDAAAVKVLTILTLIYLPTTVVSNFFSTSFVSTEPASGEAAHIVVLKDWWIFVAASVPLTILTLCIWYVWMHIQAEGVRTFLRPRRLGVFGKGPARKEQVVWVDKV